MRTRWEPKARALRDALDKRYQMVRRRQFHDTMEVSLYSLSELEEEEVD